MRTWTLVFMLLMVGCASEEVETDAGDTTLDTWVDPETRCIPESFNCGGAVAYQSEAQCEAAGVTCELYLEGCGESYNLCGPRICPLGGSDDDRSAAQCPDGAVCYTVTNLTYLGDWLCIWDEGPCLPGDLESTEACPQDARCYPGGAAGITCVDQGQPACEPGAELLLGGCGGNLENCDELTWSEGSATACIP